jgi:Transposase, Mutator family
VSDKVHKHLPPGGGYVDTAGERRVLKVRVDSRVVSQAVLVVSAVRDDGLREILAVEVADTESEVTYQDLFRSLKRRGLSGVGLVVSEEQEGLKAAIARHFQGAAHQRCLLSTTEESPRDGGSEEAKGARRRPARGVRSTEQGSGSRTRLPRASGTAPLAGERGPHPSSSSAGISGRSVR